MAKGAPIVTSAVESHSAPTKSQTGRGLRKVADGVWIYDSSSGSARRKAADARSIAAISRSRCARSAAASRPESSGLAAPRALRSRAAASRAAARAAAAAVASGERKSSGWSGMAGTFGAIFLSDAVSPSDIHPELTLTCHGFVLFYAGKLCAAACLTQKVQPFAAMLAALPPALRLSDRA